MHRAPCVTESKPITDEASRCGGSCSLSNGLPSIRDTLGLSMKLGVKQLHPSKEPPGPNARLQLLPKAGATQERRL